MNFYSNLIIFSLTNPPFEGKLTSFVAVLAQIRCMGGSRPRLYYFKVNISLSRRFMKPVMGIMDKFLLQPYHFSPANPHFTAKGSSGGIIWKRQYGGHATYVDKLDTSISWTHFFGPRPKQKYQKLATVP